MIEIHGFKKGTEVTPVVGPYQIKGCWNLSEARRYLEEKREELTSTYIEIQLVEVHEVYRPKLMPVKDEKELV